MLPSQREPSLSSTPWWRSCHAFLCTLKTHAFNAKWNAFANFAGNGQQDMDSQWRQITATRLVSVLLVFWTAEMKKYSMPNRRPTAILANWEKLIKNNLLASYFLTHFELRVAVSDLSKIFWHAAYSPWGQTAFCCLGKKQWWRHARFCKFSDCPNGCESSTRR